MARVWMLSDERYLGQRMPRALGEELSRRGIAVRLLLADRLVQPLAGAGGLADAWHGLRSGDVVVARTRNRSGLALLRSASRPGVAVLTPADRVLAVRDKLRTAQELADRGVPTPATYLADSPALLRALPPARFPLLLKPHAGDNARGIVLVRTPDELDDLDWPDSVVLAQEYVDCGAADLKVYVVGDQVWAVRRPSPLALPGRAVPAGVQRVEPTPELRALALDCGAAFGLDLYGLDVLETERGPLVVDVNEFPNYTGVDEALPAAADLVVGRLQAAVAA